MATQLNPLQGATGQDWQPIEPPPATRRRILDASRTLLRRRGFSGLSMDGVARQAGLARRTVYNHFEDRQTLFREVMLDLLLRIEEHIEFDLPADAPIAAAVRMICSGALAVLRSEDFEDMRQILGQDTPLNSWLQQIVDRRIQRPLAFAIERHLLGRILDRVPAIDAREFSSNMMLTLEAAAGTGRDGDHAQPFTLDEIANVVLTRLRAFEGLGELAPLGPSDVKANGSANA